jgi:hypothetical protein
MSVDILFLSIFVNNNIGVRHPAVGGRGDVVRVGALRDEVFLDVEGVSRRGGEQ